MDSRGVTNGIPPANESTASWTFLETVSNDPPAFAELTRGDRGILASEIGLELALDAGAGADGSCSDEATTMLCLAVEAVDLDGSGNGTRALFSLPLDVTGR